MIEHLWVHSCTGTIIKLIRGRLFNPVASVSGSPITLPTPRSFLEISGADEGPGKVSTSDISHD